MAHYALSDVSRIVKEREWQGWDDLLEWLEAQPGNAQEGLSEQDKEDLLRDMRAARDAGKEFVAAPGPLYRTIHTD